MECHVIAACALVDNHRANVHPQRGACSRPQLTVGEECIGVRTQVLFIEHVTMACTTFASAVYNWPDHGCV